MNKMKIYMDNCCLARPFDNQTDVKIKLESDAKMYIQSLVKFKSLALCSSFMLSYEIDECPIEETKKHISQFVKEFASYHVSNQRESEITTLSNEIMETGVRYKDSIHLACAIIAGCDYMITTDKRLSKHMIEKIKIINPIDFVKIWEESHD